MTSKNCFKKFTIVKLFAFPHTVSIPSHQNSILRCISDCFTLYFTLCSPLYFTLYFTLLLPSVTKLRRLCFYRCLSVHGEGGCLPQCILGYTPLGRHSPWTETPPPSRRRLLLQQTAIAADGTPPTGMHSCCIFHALFHAPFLIQLYTCTFCVTLCFYVLFYALFHVLFHAVFQIHHVTPGQQISAKTGDFVAVYKAQTGSAKLWIRTHESEYCECTHTCAHTHTHTHTHMHNPRV